MNTLIEGTPQYVQGSARKPYELKNTGGVLSCSCPAWRNQSTPIDRRTCKHLKAFLGETSEMARTTEGPKGRKLRPDEKAKLNGPPVMLAHPYDLSIDPTGWWYSEKLDGVRGYWDGKNFISRQGNIFHAPDWFKKGLPEYRLDGELYMGRQKFQQTIGVVKRLDGGDLWKQIRYVVFDVPMDDNTPYEKRMVWGPHGVEGCEYARLLPVERVKSQQHLADLLKEYEMCGAEGIMIRRPGSLYEKGRSHDLLKVKPFHDAEAVVVGTEPGKGRHKGRIGALVVAMPAEDHPNKWKTFSLGTGLSDVERSQSESSWMGMRVTYRYTELTQGGIPKCASFLRIKVAE